MIAPVALSDPVARDPAVVGAKAAGLASAAAAGLPVLPGVVVPLEASAGPIAAGRVALERGGRPAATLAVMSAAAPELGAAASVPVPLVVRSSTSLDDDGRWSGAFASYLEVEHGDLPTATRGCWASVYSGDVLARARETGIDPGEIRVGVVVQPFRRFDVGGTARLGPGGEVSVTAMLGGPTGLVSGTADGAQALVSPNGTVTAREVPPGPVRAAAALARQAGDAIGAGVIEWGTVGDEISLLQVGPAAAPAGEPAERLPAVSVPAGAERLARWAAAFPGPLFDELVLPWALGRGEVPPDAPFIPLAGDGGRRAIREARAIADQLLVEVWDAPLDVARSRAAAASALFREGRIDDALHLTRDLGGFDAPAALHLVASIGGIGRLLVAAGVLPAPDVVWRLTADEVDRAIDGEPPMLRRGPSAWEPVVAHIVQGVGTTRRGLPVSPGLGAGTVHRIDRLRTLERPVPRDVLVVRLPLPQLAPLLWHCAGLVALGGSSGAHLFEVARSLAVPAVVGAEPFDAEVGSIVAVDGDGGWVTSIPATRSVPAAAPTRAIVRG